jgi:hypothetical protein
VRFYIVYLLWSKNYFDVVQTQKYLLLCKLRAVYLLNPAPLSTSCSTLQYIIHNAALLVEYFVYCHESVGTNASPCVKNW